MAGGRIKRRVSIMVILFLMILGFGGHPTFAAGKPYKIGLVLAITGSYSSLGEPQKRAVTLIQEEVNKAGGIKGNRLEMVIIDSQSDPSKAVTGLKSLLRDPEVCGLVGGTSTADNLALIPVVEKEEITFFSGGGSIEISDPVKRYVFQLPTTDRVAMKDILNYLRKSNLTQVAMIHSTGGWGKSGAERLREQAPGAGFTVLGYESFGDKDVDMTSQLVRIRDLKPQVIISWTATTAGAIISKNIVQLGIKALHVHDHGFGNIKYVKVAGDAANGNIVPLGRSLSESNWIRRIPRRRSCSNLNRNMRTSGMNL